jgi:hypothetical protein
VLQPTAVVFTVRCAASSPEPTTGWPTHLLGDLHVCRQHLRRHEHETHCGVRGLKSIPEDEVDGLCAVSVGVKQCLAFCHRAVGDKDVVTCAGTSRLRIHSHGNLNRRHSVATARDVLVLVPAVLNDQSAFGG